MTEPRRYDLAVIGAGPAGMAGAVAAAEGGLRVALIDAGRQLGGQYFRHAPDGLEEPWAAGLLNGWAEYQRLASAVEGSRRIDVLFEHQVWSVERGFTVHTDQGRIEAGFVLLATGAYERVLPFPGWDLPGVYTAGGAQALLKANMVAVGERVVVAGTGPLLLPVAAGLLAAGSEIAGLFEAGHFRAYAKHPAPLLANPRKLAEGADYAKQLVRARIRPRSGFQVVAAEGTAALEAVVVARADGTGRKRIECDALAVGHGLVPQIDLGLTLGCEHQVFGDGTVGLRVDENQRTSVPNLYAAGEAVGVAGAQTALVEGELAGRYIARHGTRGVINSLKRQRSRQRSFADVVRQTHPVPPSWRDAVTHDTIVCRCEEVPASAITEAVTNLGATDARTVKLLTRAGMGWCQGRMCGYAVACLARTDRYGQPSPQDLLAAARRPMSRPVPLSVLAAYDGPDEPETQSGPQGQEAQPAEGEAEAVRAAGGADSGGAEAADGDGYSEAALGARLSEARADEAGRSEAGLAESFGSFEDIGGGAASGAAGSADADTDTDADADTDAGTEAESDSDTRADSEAGDEPALASEASGTGEAQELLDPDEAAEAAGDPGTSGASADTGAPGGDGGTPATDR